MKNPHWIKEEIILALDLYFKLDYGQMHGKNPAVIQLSQDLRNLDIHKEIPDKNSFRSVNSVSLKLANLKKSDQNFGGLGMRDGGKLEKELWDKFHSHRDTLSKEANLIRQHYLKPKAEIQRVPKSDSKLDFLFLCHKNRETDPHIMKAKMHIAMTESDMLRCQVCGFDFVSFYGEVGSDLMEIHDKKKITLESASELRNMEDFIIVCCNCHKVLDKNYGLLDAEDIRHIIRKA